jgi:hypothetical protein
MKHNSSTMFQAGKTYSNRKDLLEGLVASFVVISRTEKTLTIKTCANGKGYRVNIRKNKRGDEWVKISPSPYASAVHA